MLLPTCFFPSFIYIIEYVFNMSNINATVETKEDYNIYVYCVCESICTYGCVLFLATWNYQTMFACDCCIFVVVVATETILDVSDNVGEFGSITSL